jgi:hypothetical protein
VTDSSAPTAAPPVETPEAAKAGEEFAAGILRSAFSGHLIKRNPGTGLYYAP